MPFNIIRNDITKVKADAIVNTANPDVAIGEGVDLAIYEAAGRDKLLAARKKIGRLESGEVGITPAFSLDAKYIIHLSGPYWIDGLHGEAEALRRCYDRALELAVHHHCKSIAFPLLSTGSYGFSKELGLQIALEAFQAFLLKREMEIVLVVFGETAFQLSGRIFDDVREYVDNTYVERKLQSEYRNREYLRGDRRPLFSSAERSAGRAPVRLHAQKDMVEQNVCEEELCEEAGMEEIEIPRFVQGNASSMVLDSYIQQDTGTFGEYLQQLINKKGMKNSEVYAAANLTKQYFSKLLKGKVTPSKTKILSLAVALKLNMDETVDFLRMSGYAFSPFSSVDKIFEYFIRNRIYDIYRIDIVLFDYGLPTLVND